MKKLIIGALVGMVILFVWGFLSWVLLPLHHHSLKYTPQQDDIMSTLNEGMEEEGLFVLPSVVDRDIKLFDKEYKTKSAKLRKEMKGKPYAMIIYGREFVGETPMTFIYSLLFQFFAVFVAGLFLSLAGGSLTSGFQRWWLVMLFPLMITLEAHMVSWNWMMFPWHYIKGMVLDTFVSWALVGVWLAFYFKSR
ncbi:MAG: hypothetical protein IIA45_03460 [Bacteroidetes bacterium]|nr:hypothetical protein [Bacteroidota bacterium]